MMTKFDYIFIIGIARTGSKIYMNIIDLSDDTKIAPEIRFSHHFLYDIKNLIKECKNLNSNLDVNNFVNTLWSGKVNSTFWKDIENRKMSKMDLYDRIVNSNRDCKVIFSSILESYKEGLKVNRIGAKFPVSISEAPELLKWFPNCKILHIVRDPRATSASNARKWGDIIHDTIKRKTSLKIPKILIKKLLVIVNVFEWLQAFEIHKRLKNNNNYFVVRFEDLIINPEINIKKICKFLDLIFDEKMLSPPVFDSSFSSQKNFGFDKNAIDRWKVYLSKFEIRWITFITKRKMEEYGYRDIK